MRESMEPTLLYEAAGLVKAYAMRGALALGNRGPVDEDVFYDSVQVYETACDFELMAELDLEDGDSKTADLVFGQIMPVRRLLGDGAGEQAMACHLLYAAAKAASKERREGGAESGPGWVKVLEKTLTSPEVAESAWAAIRDDMARNDGVSMDFFGGDLQEGPHNPQELSMSFDKQDLADWGVDVRKVADADGLAAEWVDMMYDELVDKSNLPYVALVRALENKGYDPNEVLFEPGVRGAGLERAYQLTVSSIDLIEEDLATEGIDPARLPDPDAVVREWKETVVDRIYQDGDLRHSTLLDALRALGIDPATVMAAPAPAREDVSLDKGRGDQGRWRGAQEAFDAIARAHDTGLASGVYADLGTRGIWAFSARSIPDLPMYESPNVVEVQHYYVGDVIDPPEELEAFADEALMAERERGYTLTPGQVAGIEEAIKTVYGSWKQAVGHTPRPLSSQRTEAVRAVEKDDEARGADGAWGIDFVDSRGETGEDGLEIGGQE